uniref:Uncharacterized protein n=1 Tax=Aegilops tauschii subsp. strangulata TaxID=200361 RepID=A0A453BKQ9_AEGTS
MTFYLTKQNNTCCLAGGIVGWLQVAHPDLCSSSSLLLQGSSVVLYVLCID